MFKTVAALFVLAVVELQSPSRVPIVERLIEPQDLIYSGSFRVPRNLYVGVTGRAFDYGGRAPAFNPAGNSLFLLSHIYDQQTAEIGIPAILGTNVDALPMAAVIQPFSDALDGHLDDVAKGQGDTSTRIGGQLVFRGQLYIDTYVYYGTSGERAFYRRSPMLRSSGTQSGMAIGPHHSDFYNGYMGVVPTDWQTPLGGPVLVGNCCLSIISRTSFGPSIASVDLAALSAASTTPASALVQYPDDHKTLGWNAPSGGGINGTTQIKGLVFPDETASVLLFGRQGTGPYCYGEGTTCKDLEDGDKGDHAYPYAYYVWAYNARDLAAVKAGTKRPWDVKPYRTWAMTFPTTSRNHQLGGAAYDPATGRIFISQMFGDDDYPVIHVFTIRPQVSGN